MTNPSPGYIRWSGDLRMNVVQRRVDPEESYARKPTYGEGYRAIPQRNLGREQSKLVCGHGAGATVTASCAEGEAGRVHEGERGRGIRFRRARSGDAGDAPPRRHGRQAQQASLRHLRRNAGQSSEDRGSVHGPGHRFDQRHPSSLIETFHVIADAGARGAIRRTA